MTQQFVLGFYMNISLGLGLVIMNLVAMYLFIQMGPSLTVVGLTSNAWLVINDYWLSMSILTCQIECNTSSTSILVPYVIKKQVSPGGDIGVVKRNHKSKQFPNRFWWSGEPEVCPCIQNQNTFAVRALVKVYFSYNYHNNGAFSGVTCASTYLAYQSVMNICSCSKWKIHTWNFIEFVLCDFRQNGFAYPYVPRVLRATLGIWQIGIPCVPRVLRTTRGIWKITTPCASRILHTMQPCWFVRHVGRLVSKQSYQSHQAN